jgi:tetratricopeptide (TPR) repeat protein
MKTSHLLTSLALAITAVAAPAQAQELFWQNSYQFENSGKYVDAMIAIDAISANGPEAELKLLRRGWLFYLSGKTEESIREYRLAMERNPKSIDARLGLTLPLLAAKRWREAEQAARTVLEMAPNHYTALVRLVVAQEGAQDWQAMAKTASTLTTDYTTDATAFIYLARANAWLGKRPEAVAAYTAALARYPGQAEAKAFIEKK